MATNSATAHCQFAFVLFVVLVSVSDNASAADRYVSPSGFGSRSGDTPDNAAPFARFNEQIAAAGAGGRVLFRTDQGPYGGSHRPITYGGASGSPVTLSGVDGDGNDAIVEVVGNDRPFFELMSGADNLRFVGWSFTNTNQGAIRIRSAISGLVLERIDGTGLRQLVDTDDGASLSGFRFDRLTSSRFSKAFVGLRNASHGVIENCILDSNWQDNDPIPEGIHIDGDSYDITIRNVSIRHIVYSKFGDPDRYWNGDGIATERATRDIRIVGVYVDGAADAGFDLKGGTQGYPHRISASAATNVKRGLKVWGVTVATDVRLKNIKLPSVTLLDGSVLTQSFEAGPPYPVEVVKGARLYHSAISVDGRRFTRKQAHVGERARLYPARTWRANKKRAKRARTSIHRE